MVLRVILRLPRLLLTCGAVVAQPSEDDLRAVDREALGRPTRHAKFGEVRGQVTHLPAGAAHQVVMGGLDVGVEASLARPDLDHRNGAQVGQVVEGLVDGLERDVRHLVAHPLVDPLGRRMGHVPLQGAKDALTLGRDLATVGPEQIGKSIGRLHDETTLAGAGPISTIVVKVGIKIRRDVTIRGDMTYKGVGAAEAGDRRDRYSCLFRVHYQDVLSYARRRVDVDQAQEVVAEVFLTAWRRFDDVPDPPLPWLYRVAANEIANHTRKRWRETRLLYRLGNEPGLGPTPNHHEGPPLGGLATTVRRALETLRPADQEVLRLAAWEGLSAAAAGQVLGCSAPAFRVRLHRARTRLERATLLQETTARSAVQATAPATAAKEEAS